MKTTTLYYKDGRADKVYTASVDGAGVVQFSWGRRGGTMQTKTEGPMAPGAAEMLWSKKLAEKTAKGYVEGEAATPLTTAGFDPTSASSGQSSQPGQTGQTGLALVPKTAPKPMLLNEISDDELLRLAADPDWWMQEKKDGNRILLVKREGTLTSYSRSSRETSALPEPIVQAAMACPDDFILDGEIIGDTVFAFDLLEGVGGDVRKNPYHRRYTFLQTMFGHLTSGIVVVKTATEPDAKLELFARVRKDGGEGVVLKDATATYQSGRPHRGGPSLKYKFVATASVIVASQNTQSSFNMKLFDGTDLGRCTVAGVPRPPDGAVVEVRYLNVSVGGSLYQPVYLGVREDIAPEECVIAQLEFKGASR